MCVGWFKREMRRLSPKSRKKFFVKVSSQRTWLMRNIITGRNENSLLTRLRQSSLENHIATLEKSQV